MTAPDPQFARSAPTDDVHPRVSIVIPAYNRELYVGDTIASVVSQTMTSWQLVVVDDGSTDSTAEVATRAAANDPRITVLSGPNGGVARARNKGLDATDRRSEFVIFLDSDDIWESDALELLVKHLEQHPGQGSVYGLAKCIDDSGALVAGDDLPERMREREEYRGRSVVRIESDEPTTFAGLVRHNWVVTPGLHLIRRSILQQVGHFDPASDPADDWDLVLRLSRTADIGFIDRCVLLWRRHPDTLTSTSPRWRHAYLYVKRKSIHDPANTVAQRDVARLSFRQENLEMLHTCQQVLRRGDLRLAARLLAKAAEGQLHYLRAIRSSMIKSA